MDARLDRKKIKGFISVDGRRTCNGDGEEILLVGVGFGNWLLPEGYMWQFGGGFDRPRRIESLVAHLAGRAYADAFWPRFHDRYVTDSDLRAIAEMGFNSVRIPFNARLLMEEDAGVTFREAGFAWIDRCLAGCEKYGLYAILDLHGAPGGQTGSNIDDSFDDRPRLFMDAESRAQTIALWEEIARRYRDRWIVAAYDLLNEPLRTPRPGKPDTEPFHPALIRFYEDCIAAIRRIDTRHAISIEGANWATRIDTFTRSFDPAMIIHFHRYGTLPGEECYTEWLALGERLNAPVWLGESGENVIEWYGAMYPLAVKCGFGYNFWTWKKIPGKPSLAEITPPKGWSAIVAFTQGGPRPTYAESRAIFDAYLDAIRFEACTPRHDVANAILRRRHARIMATDFDTGPEGCSGTGSGENAFNYRGATGMTIKERKGETYVHGPGFDSGWDRLCVELSPGEWVAYTLHDAEPPLAVTLDGETADTAVLCVALADGTQAREITVRGRFTRIPAGALQTAGDISIRITCRSGRVDLHAVELGG